MPKEYTRKTEISSFTERLGSLIFFTDFEQGMQIIEGIPGTDDIVALSQQKIYSGSTSLYIATQMTNPAADQITWAQINAHVGQSKEIALECYYFFVTKSTLKYFQVDFNFTDGTNAFYAAIRLDTQNDKWQYNNEDNVITDITGGSQALLQNTFHHLRLELSFLKTKYIKLISDSLTLDLSSLSMRSTASAADSYLLSTIAICTQGANRAEAYLDNVLIESL